MDGLRSTGLSDDSLTTAGFGTKRPDRAPMQAAKLDHAECVPNFAREPALAEVRALSSWVCKTARRLRAFHGTGQDRVTN